MRGDAHETARSDGQHTRAARNATLGFAHAAHLDPLSQGGPLIPGRGALESGSARPISSGDDVNPAHFASDHAELLLRLSELDRRLKRSGSAFGDRDDELRRSYDGIAQLHRQVEEMRSSESWHLGNGAVRAVRALGGPLGPALARPRRIWRSRPANHDRVFKRAIAAGSPLALPEAEPVERARGAGDGPLALLVHELRQARLDGPRLLEPVELSALRRALGMSSGESKLEHRVRRLLMLLDPIGPVRARAQGSGSLVIDVRALQLRTACGTKVHAEQVVRTACSMLPPETKVLMLTSPSLPDVDPSVAALFDGQFVPGLTALEDVAAFLQLMVFLNPLESHDHNLLRAPWVRHAAVWLDAIIGRYPSTFLPDDADFLEYQLGIEKLGSASRVLALSANARAELPPNLDPAIRISVSGARSGLQAPDGHASTCALPGGRYCMLVGNSLSHKNIVGGVAAFARSRRARRQRTKLVVVALLNETQRGPLRALLESTGGDAADLVFRRDLERDDLARLIQGAEAVIVPSLHEGFSLPIVEALSLGTPVVASDIPPHRELLGPEPALADPRDPWALAHALDEVLARRSEVVTRQQRALSTRYDPGKLDRTVREMLADLLRPMSSADPDPKPTPVPSPRLMRTRRNAESKVRPRAGLGHSKVCNLDDFSHPELSNVLRQHFPHEVARFGPQFPEGREWRKHWEIAMAMRTFASAGLLDGRHDFLGVGAGNEPTIFLLTRHARQVVATDLYLESAWEQNANASMLTDPGWHWPFVWNPERLHVAHMDARSLRFPDESFQGIFSSSSVEHFGDRWSIGRALDEMYRVLTPGGILSISSEYRIDGPPPGMPGTAMFDARDLEELFLGDRGWSLVDAFDDTISPVTLETKADFATVGWDQQRQVDDLGGYFTHLIEFASYPHIVLATPSHTFTSFHLALRKRA